MGSRVLPLLLAAALGLACSRHLPKFQTAEVASLAGAEALAGTWFDRQGHTMATLGAGSPAYLRLRLWPRLRLRSARAEVNQIVLDCQTTGGTPVVLSLQLVDTDTAVLTRYGSPPSGCGTCTPYFVRNLPPGYLARQRIDRAKRMAGSVRDRAMDALARAF